MKLEYQCLFVLYGTGITTLWSQAKEAETRTQFKDTWRKIGDEERKAAAHGEIKKMNQLPANSTFAILKKVLELIPLQRTTSQDKELELLFAGLSL